MSAATASTTGSPSMGSQTFLVLQRVGRSLMTPIAVLPAAAILLRLGQADQIQQRVCDALAGRQHHCQPPAGL